MPFERAYRGLDFVWLIPKRLRKADVCSDTRIQGSAHSGGSVNGDSEGAAAGIAADLGLSCKKGRRAGSFNC